MIENLDEQIALALGIAAKQIQPLSGGCVGEVHRATLVDARDVVVKVDRGLKPRLEIEGLMLNYLRLHSSLPVPEVLHSSPRLLIVEFLRGESRFSAKSEENAAELLSELHQLHSQRFGFERPTLIGGLHQPNPWADSWIDFFMQHRLLYMTQEALSEGRLDNTTSLRIHNFTDRLSDWLSEPDHSSLLHGDVWSSNVLAHEDRITGFIDPAIYYGHPEIELAFITLFNTFGRAFFDAYSQLRPIEPGFFELRKDIYNLYPLLVHVRLFGGGYLDGVHRVLSRHGY